MVNIASGLGAASATAGLRVDAVGHRRANAYLLKQSSAGVAVPGVLGVNPVAGYVSSMKYKVTPFGAVLTRSPDTGAVIVAQPNTFDVTTTAAPATNPRIDIVYVYQPLEDLGDASGSAVVAVANGSPAANPSEPSIPTGALVLAKHKVMPGDTGTDTALGLYDKAVDVSIAGVIAALGDRVTVLESRPRMFSDATDPAASATVANGAVWVQPGS